MILRITLHFRPQKFNRVSGITQSFGTTWCRLKTPAHCKSYWLTAWPWAASTLHAYEGIQRAFVTLEQADWDGNVNSAFPHFSPGKGEHRYSGALCLMWYLLDVLASPFFKSCLYSIFCPLNSSLFSHLWKTTACLVYDYCWLTFYHLLLFLLYAVFKLLYMKVTV